MRRILIALHFDCVAHCPSTRQPVCVLAVCGLAACVCVSVATVRSRGGQQQRRPTNQTSIPEEQLQRLHTADALGTSPGNQQQQRRHASAAADALGTSPGNQQQQLSHASSASSGNTEEQHQRRCPACFASARRARRSTRVPGEEPLR